MLSAITIDRNKLLGIVKQNMDNHVIQFQEALSGYSLAVGHEFERLAKAAQRAHDAVVANREPNWSKIHFDAGLQRPTSHASDYETAIRMMELSVDGQLRLEAKQFNAYVMDNWEWKQQFTISVGTYTSYSQSSQFWIRS